MHPFFEITSLDIQNLNDEQARELVAKLCKAELRVKGAGTSPVTWGGDQRAKDGGVDVRVDITSGIGITGYIPKDATAFQVKAEAFPQGKIADEMAPKAILRPSLIELSEVAGAYVLVSTRDNCSDTSLRNRKNAMSACLNSFGLDGLVYLDFYDSRKIADWVESFPDVLVWLRSILGKPIKGWAPYSPWAYRETSATDEYILDDQIKIFTPRHDGGMTIIDAINQLRNELNVAKTSIRIVGLSGVGKTRLVQALFDERIVTTAEALSQENVLYTDISNNPTPQPSAMLEALLQEGSDCTVVVDNCGQDIHINLTEIAQRPQSKIRLITVEYDIRDDEPERTTCYRLEGSSDEVIAKLLKRHYQNLSELDINKIVEFSNGNARVAFALASTSQERDELARLTDDALFRRLFEQKNAPNEELQRCAEAASLLYSFDVEDFSDHSELAALSSIAEVSPQTFFRNINTLEGRGLVQKRGKWRAVLPHAISNRLALLAVKSVPPRLLIQKLVTDTSDRVARSFSRRLGYLHESAHAQEIVAEWLTPDGLLGNTALLNDLKKQMLINIAPVNQRAVLNVILRSMSDPDFTAFSNPNHLVFTRLLRSICYEPELFDDAATALLHFALNEPTDNKANSSRDLLKSLFFCHLSGTHASPEQRASFIRNLAVSDDYAKQKIAVLLLGSALESQYFTCGFGFDFGALKRDYGWHPRSHEEFLKWYELFVQIATELGKQPTVLGSDARHILGTAFRGLWGNTQIEESLTLAAQEITAVVGWPDGWIGARNVLYYDKEVLSPDSLARLKALEKKLAPQDLMSEIQAKVLSRGAIGSHMNDEYDLDSEISWYEKAGKEVQSLGRAAALDKHALADITPYLSREKQTERSWDFGFGVGEAATSTLEILDRARKVIETKRNEGINSIFIRGLISGWAKTHPTETDEFLDKAVCDDVWGSMLPELQTGVRLDNRAHSRLIRCLENGITPARQFQYLGWGRMTDPFSMAQIASIMSLLATKLDDGLNVAIHVLSMVTLSASEKDQEYQATLQAYCFKFIDEVDWLSFDFNNNNLTHHLVRIIDYGISNKSLNKEAIESMKRLIAYVRSQDFHQSIGSVLAPYFKYYPQESLDASFFEEYDVALHLLAGEYGRGDSAITSVSEEELIKWSKHSPEQRCAFVAHACQLFEVAETFEASAATKNSISSTAISVLALAPNKKEVLEIYVKRFCPNSWSGSRAAIMRQRQQLLDQLNPKADVDLQLEINVAKKYLSQIISREERWEQEQERSQTSSFE